MAKKIRTFTEYDAARRERELDLPLAVQSKLEQMIRINLRKSERRLGGVEIIAHPVDFLKALLQGPERMMQLYLEQQIEIHTPKAEQEATLEYFQHNMRELIGCGVSISKPHGSLDDEQKQSFYARFLDNVKEFTDSKHFAPFKIRYSGIEDLLCGFRPPEREEKGFLAVVSVTEGLCREKYITRENADTIVRLLSSRPEAPGSPLGTLTVRPGTPAPVPEPAVTEFLESREKKNREERLEYLTILFNLDADQASYLADRITLEQLESLQEEMKKMVGEDYFLRMVNLNPAILLYPTEKIFLKYHRTLTLVMSRIRRNGSKESLEEKFGLERNVERYASLEGLLKLKEELLAATGEYTTVQPQPEAVFDLEEYKDQLLLKAGMNVPIVRAYTHGKTVLFKGEYYIPLEYFRKNATGKVPANILDPHWQDVFEEMVRLKAITKKPKDASPLYRLNPHINEITNIYLREYMRVTLYAAQILAQEGEITPKINLGEK